jgi:heat shock protein HslJ
MNQRKFLFFCMLGVFTLALAGCGLMPAADPLDGTSWVLISYDKNQPIEGTSLTAKFSDGQVGGSSGCNSYGGSYEVSGDKLTIGEVAWTLMACLDEGVMAQEQRFMELLTDAQTFTLSGDRLEITASDGRSMLVFEPLGD